MRELLERIKSEGYKVQDSDLEIIINFFKANNAESLSSPALRAIGANDIDTASYLLDAVVKRDTIIVSDYRAQGTGTSDPSRIVTSKQGRHGQLTEVSSNSKNGKFGVNFKDMNVMQKKEDGKIDIGQATIMNCTNEHGDFYNGIKTINNVSDGKVVEFGFPIHPKLAEYLYRLEYQVVVAMFQRCKEEEKHLRGEIKKIRAKLGIVPEPWPKSDPKNKTITFTEFDFDKTTVELGAANCDVLPEDKYNKFTLKTYEERAGKMNNMKKRMQFIRRMIEGAWMKNKGVRTPNGEEWREATLARKNAKPKKFINIDGFTIEVTEREVTVKV